MLALIHYVILDALLQSVNKITLRLPCTSDIFITFSDKNSAFERFPGGRIGFNPAGGRF